MGRIGFFFSSWAGVLARVVMVGELVFVFKGNVTGREGELFLDRVKGFAGECAAESCG
jgi:hypothetical protein